MSTRLSTAILMLVVSGVWARPADAQNPAGSARPARVFGNASAGFSLTRGNANSTMINVGYEVALLADARNTVKSELLLIRGTNEERFSADRLGFRVRDEVALSRRAYAYGENQYLSDTFKQIDYFVAPTSGAGYRFIDTPATQLNIDVGVGVVAEKRPKTDLNPWFCLTSTEKLSHKLSPAATVSQSFTGIWKARDVGNSLYTIGAAITSAVTTHVEIKLEALDTFRNSTPSPAVKKNDVALLGAFVYKM